MKLLIGILIRTLLFQSAFCYVCSEKCESDKLITSTFLENEKGEKEVCYVCVCVCVCVSGCLQMCVCECLPLRCYKYTDRNLKCVFIFYLVFFSFAHVNISRTPTFRKILCCCDIINIVIYVAWTY